MARVKPVFDLDPSSREAIIDTLTDLLRAESDVVFAYVYGSFAGEDEFRDIDVGLFLANSPDQRTARALEISGRLSTRAGYPVDVRPLNAAPVTFLFHVLYAGRLLVSRNDELLADLIERTARSYHDIAPLLRESTVEAFGHDAQP